MSTFKSKVNINVIISAPEQYLYSLLNLDTTVVAIINIFSIYVILIGKVVVS